MHPLHDYFAKQLADKLTRRGVVVWYDPRRELMPFFDELRASRSLLPRTMAPSARSSRSRENKRNFLDVAADIMEHVDPIFFGDPKIGAMKVLGLT